MQLKDFDEVLHKKHGLPKGKTRALLADLERELRGALVFGHEVNIYNVGKFTLQIRKARNLRDINSGELVHYPKHYKLVFRVVPKLITRIREKTVY